MTKTASFGAALKALRNARKLSQEDFSDVSSRTYLSSLERGLKSPTLGKINELTEVLNVHPLTLLVAAYAGTDPVAVDKVLARVRAELVKVLG